jgi:F-type H+-transporting ATPase subunit b
MKEDTQARVEQELKLAGNLLRAEAVKLSVEMAEELLKRNITAADHDAMVKDYLDKVVSKH